MKCSHYELYNIKTKSVQSSPCIIYLHCNTGSRLEAQYCLDILIPLGISLFCFDFSGCGLSGGDYITLGWLEKDDVETIIKYLKNNQKTQKIGLWGRSMGAVTALLYAEKDPNLLCLILDSPFCSLNKLAEDVAISKTKLPGFVIKGALSLIKQTIFKKTKLNMNYLNLDKISEKINIPALFTGSKEDSFVKFWHLETIFKHYKGNDKQIYEFKADHNDSRPDSFFSEVSNFISIHFFKKNKSATQNELNISTSAELDKENSPFLSNKIKNLNVNVNLASKNKEIREKNREKAVEHSDFLENFSKGLKNISEKDFLHFFKGNNIDDDSNERTRAITHDGKLESKENLEKNYRKDLENSLLLDEREIPIERVERSISALNDYSTVFQNKNTILTENPMDNSINEVIEEENSPIINEKKRKINGSETIKSVNFGRNIVKTPVLSIKLKTISTKPLFKPNFTRKLQNIKVIHQEKNFNK